MGNLGWERSMHRSMDEQYHHNKKKEVIYTSEGIIARDEAKELKKLLSTLPAPLCPPCCNK